jgi:hypothetical protein
MSESGAPKNIEGIASRNVCVTDIAMIKQHKETILVYCSNIGEKLRSKTEIKLMCIPGIRPVMIPQVIPKAIAIVNSKNIF